MKIELRPSIESDLEHFFNHQADEDAIHMAAFTAQDPQDKEAYLSKWKKLLHKDGIHMQTIITGDAIVGCVVKFEMEGEAHITYAIAKAHWGKGIASQALSAFIQLEDTRPLWGWVAFDNIGSQRVLERAGFKRVGEETSFANARNTEIVEYIYKLDQV